MKNFLDDNSLDIRNLKLSDIFVYSYEDVNDEYDIKATFTAYVVSDWHNESMKINEIHVISGKASVTNNIEIKPDNLACFNLVSKLGNIKEHIKDKAPELFV